MPLDDFYNYPGYQILKVWQGVKLAKAKDINALSLANANIASMVYEYLRDHKNSQDLTVNDFLPYDLKSIEQSELIDKETATIIVKARDEGNLPPNILADIINVPDLYQAILLMAEQTKQEDGFRESI